MDYDDLKEIYLQYENQFGKDAYKQISKVLAEAKERHEQDWAEDPSEGGDLGQSWRVIKGNGLERLIQDLITVEVEPLGLKVISGKLLKKAQGLSQELSQIKRNILVDYGEFGCHLPDADIIIYQPDTCKVLAIISSKSTLRERIAQTGYWKLKLLADEATKHIKIYLISPDEDGTLKQSRRRPKKSRAIVELDLDGTYLLTEAEMPDSEKIKLFEHFIEDFQATLADTE